MSTTQRSGDRGKPIVRAGRPRSSTGREGTMTRRTSSCSASPRCRRGPAACQRESGRRGGGAEVHRDHGGVRAAAEQDVGIADVHRLLTAAPPNRLAFLHVLFLECRIWGRSCPLPNAASAKASCLRRSRGIGDLSHKQCRSKQLRDAIPVVSSFVPRGEIFRGAARKLKKQRASRVVDRMEKS
jgi:hypothetical protein